MGTCGSRQEMCVYGTEASPVSLESVFEGKNEWEVLAIGMC